MPYLLLIVGLLIGVYALYRFFLNADVKQIKALLMTVAIVVLSAALFLMAITERLPAALALLVVLVPLINNYRKSRIHTGPQAGPAPSSPVMDEKEALEVLGLQPGATALDIDRAYKKLMLKVHPDSAGTDWMATKLNQARDLLTGKP